MKRIKEEQRVVEQMIRLYCRKKEGNNELCPGCQELLQYATARLERCKFGENWKSHATLTLLAKQDCPLWLQYD